jgi:hypothetical protein
VAGIKLTKLTYDYEGVLLKNSPVYNLYTPLPFFLFSPREVSFRDNPIKSLERYFMNILRLIILVAVAAHIGLATASEAKSSCVVKTQDPVSRAFFHSKGYEVDFDKGDFQVDFEVTCEAVDKFKEKFNSSEIHKTTTKIEVFNIYEGKKMVYHTEEDVHTSGRVESSFVVPCENTKAAKLKLLANAMNMIQDINCDDEEE